MCTQDTLKPSAFEGISHLFRLSTLWTYILKLLLSFPGKVKHDRSPSEGGGSSPAYGEFPVVVPVVIEKTIPLNISQGCPLIFGDILRDYWLVYGRY